MANRILIIFTLLICSVCVSYAQLKPGNDKDPVMVFEAFKNALQKVYSSSDPDTSALNQVAGNFLFYFSLDSIHNKFRGNPMSLVHAELFNLSQFFAYHQYQDIVATPLALMKDKSVYPRMSDFQKQNALAITDKKKPDEVILFMLLIPGEYIKSEKPRILSWKLGFSYGIIFFEDLVGNQGMEAFFEGVKSPKHPVKL